MTTTSTRTGSWAHRTLGLRLLGTGPDGPALHDLVGLALRHNPRRAHLLVSTVLGKHVPADPGVVHGTGLQLGGRVRALVGPAEVTVLGFAETATGLGHCVAEALGAPYLHSTRRAVPGVAQYAAFEEEHSHATGHRLLPEHPGLLAGDDVLVLVDDELSTGRTALNTIAALHAVSPRRGYLLAALVDLRAPHDVAHLADVAATLGVPIDVVALASGTVEAPADLKTRAATVTRAAVTRAAGATRAPNSSAAPPGEVAICPRVWPDGVREGGRHGFGPADVRAAHDAADAVAADLAPTLPACAGVLVLGTEELMYAPTLIALHLQARGFAVRVSSTTRSPVVVLDEPGYPIRDVLEFAGHDPAQDGPGQRFAYNVGSGFTDVVLVLDADADTPAAHAGLIPALRATGSRAHVVPVPCYRPPTPLRGPSFGSYAPDEVGWLLSDLSGVALEAPTHEREEAVQAGGAHYAESLPIEYQPDAAYRALFTQALDLAAERVAYAVGVVTEIVLAERGAERGGERARDLVLASLARAGTPVGVLMRRWALFAHGLDLPHYALSIVRGRGLDVAALRYLAAHHDPAGVVFVDGWTGKGAIAGELAAAVTQVNAVLGTAFDPSLAVLADPGGCVRTFGTREDFLIPSACLNSTVSGLVSRTVRNDRIIAPGRFDGAKFYAGLAPDDVSAAFLDAVSGCFPDVAARVAADWPVRQAADRHPTWAGRAEVERLSAEHGIGDVTLVKPGVGETTRVLLRRVPWAVLVRAGSAGDRDLAHVRLLAAERGVPVREVDGLTYRCVGLIHPRYTRGASGADGQAVRP